MKCLLKAVRQLTHNIMNNHLSDNVKKLVVLRKHDSKNSTICMLVTVLFIICWVPFAVYYVSFVAGMNYTLPMAKNLFRALELPLQL